MEHSKYSRNAKTVSRSIREVDTEEIDNQFSIFLERLGKELDTEPISKIEKINSKDIMKTFMTNPELYRGIEMIMQATLVGAIKIGVESVTESVISKYSIHNSKIRNIKDKTANNEMFIAVNGPKVGQADETIKKALDRKFGGRGGWHFSTKQN